MAGVTLEQVRKVYNETVAVHGMDLTIQDGEFLVLVGPSGCGKSTCLRMVAGLEELSGGRILIGDREVNDVPPQDRDIAMVFQNYALYPHMSVYDNLAFGLRLRRQPSGTIWPRTRRTYGESEIRRRVEATADMLGLSNLLRRKPRQLSGGQRQRVALGRAIVREPRVFLMDEPLSNLDAKLRVETRGLLLDLHQRLRQEGKDHTVIYVTHDQTEAMTMGDRIAVMDHGHLQQCDAPLELYRRPANRFVAEFIGSPQMNVVGPFRVEADGSLATEGWHLRLPAERGSALTALAGREVLFGIRPEDIADSATTRVPPTDGNQVPVEVRLREPLGAQVHLRLEAPLGIELTAMLDADSPAWRDPQFTAVLDLTKAHVFDPANNTALF